MMIVATATSRHLHHAGRPQAGEIRRIDVIARTSSCCSTCVTGDSLVTAAGDRSACSAGVPSTQFSGETAVGRSYIMAGGTACGGHAIIACRARHAPADPQDRDGPAEAVGRHERIFARRRFDPRAARCRGVAQPAAPAADLRRRSPASQTRRGPPAPARRASARSESGYRSARPGGG